MVTNTVYFDSDYVTILYTSTPTHLFRYWENIICVCLCDNTNLHSCFFTFAFPKNVVLGVSSWSDQMNRTGQITDLHLTVFSVVLTRKHLWPAHAGQRPADSLHQSFPSGAQVIHDLFVIYAPATPVHVFAIRNDVAETKQTWQQIVILPFIEQLVSVHSYF